MVITLIGQTRLIWRFSTYRGGAPPPHWRSLRGTTVMDPVRGPGQHFRGKLVMDRGLCRALSSRENGWNNSDKCESSSIQEFTVFEIRIIDFEENKCRTNKCASIKINHWRTLYSDTYVREVFSIVMCLFKFFFIIGN